MFTVPFSQYQSFCLTWNSIPKETQQLRFGQGFYNFANLHKMTQTNFLDKLYNASNDVAKKMLLNIIDYSN